MTEMSEPHGERAPHDARNTAYSLGGSPLARPLHDVRALVVPLPASVIAAACAALLCAAAGCILPPSLSTGSEDAGVNSPPSITAVRTDADNLFEPGPISLVRNSGTINFELLDTDAQDTLTVRVFIGYRIEDPTPARAQCTAPPTGEPKRAVTCTASAICQASDVGKTLQLSVVVFDRLPLETGKPEYQAMPEQGLSTSRFFFAECAGPQT